MWLNMRKIVKKYFIPQEENNHKPYFLRRKALCAIAVFVFFVEIAFFANVYFFSSRVDFLASVLPSVLVSLTNENRDQKNLSPLSTNPMLQLAAQMKANDMATKGYFSHTSPDGLEPWYWLKQVGYSYSYAGENLAVDFVDSDDVTDAWMKSPTHRANMINQNYREVGIAVAPGKYKGRDTLFVVQFFGTPKDKVTLAQNPVPPVESKHTDAGVQTKTQKTQKIVSIPKTQDTFSSVENVILGTETKANIADIKPITSSKINSFLRPIEKIITSPRQLSDYVFGILIIFLAFVLALTIFIAIKAQHLSTIAGAIAMIIFVAGMIYFNNFIFNSDGVAIPSDFTAATIEAF